MARVDGARGKNGRAAFPKFLVGDLELACAVALGPTLDPSFLGEQLFRMCSVQHYLDGGMSRADFRCNKCTTREVNEGTGEAIHEREPRTCVSGAIRWKSSGGLSE